MLKLQCQKCSFEFEKEKAPNRCPYCAGEGTVSMYKTAQDFLDEIEI